MANGIIGALNAFLENKRRVAKRNLSDLMEDPADFTRMMAPRIDEDLAAQFSRPESAMDLIAGPVGGLAGVIKPKGGNWLPDSLNKALGRLKKRDNLGMSSPDETAFAAGIPIEEAIKNWPADKLAINKWLEGPLRKYIQRDMATEGDPIRKLASENVLHYEPITNNDIRTGADWVRAEQDKRGFLGDIRSEPDTLARRWEDLTDIHIEPNYIGEGNPFPFKTDEFSPKDMEWLEKARTAPQQSQIFGSYLDPGMTRELGFNHLVDELSNSLNPASGLPRALQLRPEQMQQMGIEKAVRHVDAVNKWRAAQKIEANRQMAEKASILREYPENNPMGLRWVEIGPKKDIDETLIQVGKDGGAKVDIPGEDIKYFETPDEARKYLAGRGVQEQLKYEGDAMGHCVGGYCPDVLEGRSRIFSLRDAKGEPHVTIETSPFTNSLSGNKLNEVEQGLFNRWLESGEVDMHKWLKENRPELYSTNDVIQIKGKQNKKPKDEYIPYVQDFIRNSPIGRIGSVGDLTNARMQSLAIARDFNKDTASAEFLKYLDDQMAAGVHYMDEPELRKIYNKIEGGGDDPVYAQGGHVTPKAMLARIQSAYNEL